MIIASDLKIAEPAAPKQEHSRYYCDACGVSSVQVAKHKTDGMTMNASEKTVLVDGLRVRYWEAGNESAKTLLLLHGGLGDARFHWEASIGGLAENFRVLAPDLPGFGGSQALPHNRTETMLHWIKAFLHTLRVDQAVVVGNSFGALLARLFAANSPTYVPAVILVNGGGVPDIPNAFRVLERIPLVSPLLFGSLGKRATSEATLKEMITVAEVLTPEFVAQVAQAAPGYTRFMRMLVSSPMPATQNPIVPTLILWGTNDQVALLSDGKAIQASIAGSQLVEIADCGHMPQIETSDVFIWQVNTFLDKLSRPTKPTSGPSLLSNASG